jgi:hypothetical protein
MRVRRSRDVTFCSGRGPFGARQHPRAVGNDRRSTHPGEVCPTKYLSSPFDPRNDVGWTIQTTHSLDTECAGFRTKS